MVEVGEVGFEVRVEEDSRGNLEDLENEEYNPRSAIKTITPSLCLALEP